MKVYNKLVRDKIPAIIEADGKTCEVEIAPKEKMTRLIEDKLVEEVNEYLEDKNLEELADVMEVLFGIACNLRYTEEELVGKREEKLGERGRFKAGIVLKGLNEFSSVQ
ncbi:nucleoside triphosphate pyrophosphohydrolase [Clostridium gasigenes]|uniref:nucleoside triphosphate pyrophosphohydrolase n=1 Tax=Clostridium gasigenes TaxID=94869 RepID=UPI0014383C6F|nr:nucleoside triphosphate pyrophosphohydrolase [Clostridium gasigenes]NKF05691.1 nucleoside triphosphate pyrophosphohydrolase [Clostridium gasigenes]QSW19125.1 nucleoside triphosphate pyrophosphohydrolase [Clostridium gasigenes]